MDASASQCQRRRSLFSQTGFRSSEIRSLPLARPCKATGQEEYNPSLQAVLQASETRRCGATERKKLFLRSGAKERFDEAVLSSYVTRRHRGDLAFA